MKISLLFSFFLRFPVLPCGHPPAFVSLSFQTSQTPGLEPHLTRREHKARFVKTADGNFVIFSQK